MATKLDGKKTFFLPFNKGYNYGKGNPTNMNGHKTAYLWEDVLSRVSLTKIIEHFAKEVDEKDPKARKKQRNCFSPATTSSTWYAKSLLTHRLTGSASRT